MRVILASQSPRRRDLLKYILDNFEIMVSDANEELKEGLSIENQVINISNRKAKAVFEKTFGDRIVIGSDTMVVKNGKIYGKPKNKENAKEIIKELLSGDKSHRVITGLSIMVEVNGVFTEYNTYDAVTVYFKDISDAEIEKWINTGKAMDKAGAYAMQEDFCVHIDKIDGNYATAIGFPVHKAYDILKNYI